MSKYTVNTNIIHLQITAKNDDEAILKANSRLKELLNLGAITLKISKKD